MTIARAAAMQAAIVPITGKMLDYPGLILVFLFFVFAAIAYFSEYPALSAVGACRRRDDLDGLRRHFRARPDWMGFDLHFRRNPGRHAGNGPVRTAIWPSPPEPRLLESIAADFARTRRASTRGAALPRPFSAPLPAPLAQSTLAPNLTLLNSVEEYMRPAPAISPFCSTPL